MLRVRSVPVGTLSVLAITALLALPTPAVAQAPPDSDAVRRLEEELEKLQERIEEIEVTARRKESAPEPGPIASALSEVRVDGSLSAGYTWNLAEPPGRRGVNRFRLSDVDHNSFVLPTARLGLYRSLSGLNELDAGFRVDVMAGAFAQEAFRNDGLSSSSGFPINLSLAYVEGQLPTLLGRPLTIKLGRQASFFGVESLDLAGNLNYSLSHAATFSPRTLTGVSLGLDLGAGLSYTQWFGNGWDVVIDNNHAKSIGGQLLYRPAGLDASLAVNWILGAERSDSEGDKRWMVEVAGTWKPTSSLDLRAAVHYGEEDGANLSTGGLATFTGVVLMARQGFFEVEGEGYHRLALAVRGGYYRDSGGSRTGEDQSLAELTATVELRLLKDAALRFEYRRDWSTKAAFVGSSGPFERDEQDTVSVQLSYAF